MAFRSCYCPHCGAGDWQSDALAFEEVVCPKCRQSYTLMPSPTPTLAGRGFPVLRSALVLLAVLFAMIAFLAIHCVCAVMPVGC